LIDAAYRSGDPVADDLPALIDDWRSRPGGRCVLAWLASAGRLGADAVERLRVLLQAAVLECPLCLTVCHIDLHGGRQLSCPECGSDAIRLMDLMEPPATAAAVAPVAAFGLDDDIASQLDLLDANGDETVGDETDDDGEIDGV